MTENRSLTILKIVMVIGIVLIVVGHYLLSYTSAPETYGVNGLIFSGSLMAFGIILSLPTKMYLTFVFVKNENERREKEKALKKQQGSEDL